MVNYKEAFAKKDSKFFEENTTLNCINLDLIMFRNYPILNVGNKNYDRNL